MAITAVSLGVVGHGWAVNATSANMSGCEEILAAPAAGSIVVEQIHISTVVKDLTVTIGAGATAGAVTTVVLGPIAFNAEVTAAGYSNLAHYAITFTRPIKLAATTALTIDASAAGVVQVFASGYYI